MAENIENGFGGAKEHTPGRCDAMNRWLGRGGGGARGRRGMPGDFDRNQITTYWLQESILIQNGFPGLPISAPTVSVRFSSQQIWVRSIVSRWCAPLCGCGPLARASRTSTAMSLVLVRDLRPRQWLAKMAACGGPSRRRLLCGSRLGRAPAPAPAHAPAAPRGRGAALGSPLAFATGSRVVALVIVVVPVVEPPAVVGVPLPIVPLAPESL